MASLPTPGGDGGTWGAQLNGYLTVSLNSDGTINPAALPSFGTLFYGDGSDGPLVVPATPRTVSDFTLTLGSLRATSATANFTSADVGVMLDDQTYGGQWIMPGARIMEVVSSTEVTLNFPPRAESGTTLYPDTVIIGQGWLLPGSYTTITIESGATAIVPNNAFSANGQIQCSVSYTIDGTLDLSGTGTPTAATGNGSDSNASYGAYLGGNGGNGTNPGGIFYVRSAPANPYRQPINAMTVGAFGAPGGAGGGGDGTHFGGGGGYGGMTCSIIAKSVVHGSGAVYALAGQAGQAGGLAQPATLYPSASPALPFTVTSGSNDEFVYTPSGGSAETFTVAPGTYYFAATLALALNAATGSTHGEPFSTYATVGQYTQVTTVAGGSSHNSDTITAGANDIAASLGWTGQSFTGAADAGGNCGGGGGGADGWWITISDTISGSPAVTGGGGAGGAGSGTGSAGTAGQAGFGIHYLPGSVITSTP